MNNETKTYATIKLETFVTPEGKHTCSSGLSKDCKFLRLTRWGCTFVCGYNNAELNRGSNEGYGFLIPDEGCPLVNVETNKEVNREVYDKQANIFVRVKE